MTGWPNRSTGAPEDRSSVPDPDHGCAVTLHHRERIEQAHLLVEVILAELDVEAGSTSTRSAWRLVRISEIWSGGARARPVEAVGGDGERLGGPLPGPGDGVNGAVGRQVRADPANPFWLRPERVPRELQNGSAPHKGCRPVLFTSTARVVVCLSGDVLVSHTLPCAVPSALKGLTSGFGM